MTFTLSSSHAGDVVVVAVRGDLDMGTAPALWSHVSGLMDHGRRQILIDCSGLTFLDCFGLSALLCCRRAVRGHGGWLHLSKVNVTALRLLALTGLALALLSEDGMHAVPAAAVPAASEPAGSGVAGCG